MGKLDGKVILVTGGSTGIGRASCFLFGREGARVVFCGRRADEGAKTEAELRAKGYQAVFRQADISKAAQVEKLIAEIAAEYGRLDGAFNCGGVDGVKASLIDTTEEDWDSIVGINLKGTFLLLKNEIKQMLVQGGGTIVNMSSVCAVIARPGRVAYNASRHGVDALTKTAALEYASKGVRVNAVSPGSVRTDIFYRSTGGDPAREALYAQGHPLGRIGEPEEIAKAALWLLTEAPEFMVGHTLMLDGGFTLQ
jgi:NAD(P)-dependent dehydrogenase (short-subunit alcohol dehydrogenase family)